MSKNMPTADDLQQGPLNAVEWAQFVIRTEAAGLDALADALIGPRADDFTRAVSLVAQCERHLVVVGVGKSGHIGQKLAASFASTGTPSFFMHPTEASHGDLGMVVPGSVVLAISNSGESQELADVLGYCRRNSIPVIGITTSVDSTLGRGSDVVLRLPKRAEACVNRLAPTTSTTMTLAMGDALVVAIMDQRGFTATDFGRRHPGGKLGRRLQTVGEWLVANPHDIPHVTPDTAFQDVIMSITEGQNGCVAVVENPNDQAVFSGIITDGDLRRAMKPGVFDRTAADIMTVDALSLRTDMTMGQAVDHLVSRRVATAFILDDQRPIGLVNIKALAAQGYL